MNGNTSEAHPSPEGPLVCVLCHIPNVLTVLQVSPLGPFLDVLLKTKPDCTKQFVCTGDTTESSGRMEQSEELKT